MRLSVGAHKANEEIYLGIDLNTFTLGAHLSIAHVVSRISIYHRDLPHDGLE